MNDLIKKYLNHNSRTRFHKLFNELIEVGVSRDTLEKLCTSKRIKNMYHLGMFYFIGGRLLEASYYFEIYLKDNPNDIEALVQLQFVAAKRGDLKLSSNLIQQIVLTGRQKELQIAIALHSLASGHRDRAGKAAQMLFELEKSNLNNLDDFTLMTIYEVGLTTKDYDVLKKLISFEKGRTYLKQINSMDQSIIKQVFIDRLLLLLRTKLG